MCSKLSRRYARDLRKAQTYEEALLWEQLRNRKLVGIKFVRQYAISFQRLNNTEEFIIAGIYCARYKFIIEVDGGYHNEIRDIDANRDETLLVQLGIRTLRIENEELINMPAVINKIIAFINTLGPPQSY